MRKAGFTEVVSADGDVADLARFVAERVKPDDRLLYLAGEDRSGDLAGDLRARGLMVHTARGLSRRRGKQSSTEGGRCIGGRH